MIADSASGGPSTSTLTFLESVQRAGLLSERQIEKARSGLNSLLSDEDLAAHLVQQGQLTTFQVDRIRSGRTDGFFLGQYMILEPIASSVIGKVYKARHRTMGRLVAIKVLAPERTQEPANRDLYSSQARIAGQLVHPNIITLFDANQIVDRMYFVMEYVEGVSLGARVQQHGAIPKHEACEIARQIAVALDYAHGRGITHGALTPANLLILRDRKLLSSDQPIVKVLNFAIGQLTLSEWLSRAPENAMFLAPETTGSKVAMSQQADLYSLGAILFLMLTGKPPTIEYRALEELPPAIKGLVEVLLSHDPARRPTASGAIASLEHIIVNLSGLTGMQANGLIDFDLPAYESPNSTSVSLLTGLKDLSDKSPFEEMTDSSPTVDTHTRTPISIVKPSLTSRRGTQGYRRPGSKAAYIVAITIALLVIGFLIGAAARLLTKA